MKKMFRIKTFQRFVKVIRVVILLKSSWSSTKSLRITSKVAPKQILNAIFAAEKAKAKALRGKTFRLD